MLVGPGEVAQIGKGVARRRRKTAQRRRKTTLCHQKTTRQHLCWVLVAEGGGCQCAAGVDGCGTLAVAVLLVQVSGCTALVKTASNNKGFELEVTDVEQEMREGEAGKSKVQEEYVSCRLQCGRSGG